MDKITYDEYFSLYWLARKEALKDARILKEYKGKPQWNFWLELTKKYANLAIKAKKLATAHIAD